MSLSIAFDQMHLPEVPLPRRLYFGERTRHAPIEDLQTDCEAACFDLQYDHFEVVSLLNDSEGETLKDLLIVFSFAVREAQLSPLA
jgi:hypothetical protein